MLSFGTLASRLFGSSNERKLKKYWPVVPQINALEPEIEKLSDAGLRDRTDTFRARLAKGETLDELLPEASPSCARPPSARSASAISTCR